VASYKACREEIVEEVSMGLRFNCCLFGALFALSSATWAIDIETPAIKGDRLPLPGKSLTLRAYISGSRDIELPVKLIVELDGRAVTMNTYGSRDEKDRIVYSAEIFAPQAELNYQFLLVNSDGSLTTSKRYLARRPCLPDVSLVGEDELQKINDSQNAVKLLGIAKRLERDNELYGTAEAQIRKLGALLSEGK
jgi:hypothetical protein